MIDVFRKVFSLLDAQERRRFWVLTVLMVFVALVEVAGVSSVLILLNVLSDPTTVDNSRALSWLRGVLGTESVFSFQVALAVVVIVVVFAGLVIKAGGTYAIIRYSFMRGSAISTRLLRSYLNRPYEWFLDRNSSEIGKNVLTEVDNLTNRVLTPTLRLTSNFILVIAMLGFLMVVDPLITVLSAVVLGGFYVLIYLRLRGLLHSSGQDMMGALEQRYRTASEATGGIKDIKLLGLEPNYEDQFGKSSVRAARAVIRVGIMAELPRFVLEAITFGALLGLVLVLLFRSEGNMADIVPTLGIFAFSVMRLLPALQQTYYALANIRGSTAALDGIVRDYTEAKKIAPSLTPTGATLPVRQSLELKGISFRYASANRDALSNLDLTIPARTTVGLVGGTGAGKTTLVDLILGLLTQNSGEVRVDGTLITEANRRAWQNSLGYVPQSIYLTDDTVAANIAFGVPKDQIDRAALERAARAAALHDFVMTDLADGYDTMVGERGIRLSGGQRQRIGIARALYRTPSLLIMDEATSALDNITERVVMEAVQNIRADTTIILIAHRLTTVKDCDRIFLLEKGRVAASGTYDELVDGNATFRNMAVGT